jgi:RNA polymerase sigma-70 factor, ECF subfamily
MLMVQKRKVIFLDYRKDEGEFIRVYTEYKTKVYYFALSILKDRGLSEDIMQEVFIRVRANAYKYGEIDNLKTLIMKITRNLALNCIRDRRFEASSDLMENNEAKEDFTEYVTESVVINKALNSLSEEERQVFILHVLGGYKHREISGIMAIPQGTVRWKYADAKEKLRKLLNNL